MANLNDEKILTLKSQIEEKEKLINKTKRFSPKTNCILNFYDKTHNIQVLDKGTLMLIGTMLHVYADKSKELGWYEELKISGYHISDWISDIQSRIDVISVKDEEAKLKTMKATLDNLLSTEKKTELELEAIAKELGI